MANKKKVKESSLHPVDDDKNNAGNGNNQQPTVTEVKTALMNDLKYRVNRNRLKIV